MSAIRIPEIQAFITENWSEIEDIMKCHTYMAWWNVLSAEKIQKHIPKAEDNTFWSDPSYKYTSEVDM